MEDKLFNASMKFHLACVVKLKEKEKAGWTGWDNPDSKRILGTKLMEHTIRPFTQNNLINISNYCMFLWNLIEITRKEEE